MQGYRFWLAVAVLICIAGKSSAQQVSQLGDILSGKPLAGKEIPPQETPESVISVTAKFTATQANQGLVSVTAKVQSGWHVYSLTQKPVEALPTVITVDNTAQYRLAGSFRPTLPPHAIKRGENDFEEYEGEVTWQAPVELRSGVDPSTVTILGQARIQACQETRCLPPHIFSFAAALAAAETQPPAAPQAAASGAPINADSHVTLLGHLEPKVAVPGGQARLVIEAVPAEHWHVYELADRDPNALGSKPTLIAITNSSGFQFTQPVSSAAAVEGPPVEGLPLQRYYEEPVTWTTTISVPKDAQAGQYKIEGLVGYQVCSGSACDMPQGTRFEGAITVGNAETAGDVPLVLGEARYGEVAKVAAAQAPPKQADSKAAAPSPVEHQVVEIAGTKFDSLAMVLGAALVGGFILNFMPCVLPVIGLKILSFAEQAGRSRAHVLTLNLWYSAGLMSVFLVLATLAAGASLGLRDENLGWGEQFSSTTFNIVMACVVFVMALSFLGVWEIPIPGFVGTGAAANAAAQEGAAGAFAKGALSTVLATPCSGPLLGPVFAYTLKQPPAMTYLLFVFVGLGMAAPYLAIGAFPQLIRFLPKPGAWMDTFKHMMGFVLLGTIVFLFTIIDPDYLVPTFALMVALWAACWWIGRISLVRPFSERSAAWIQGMAFAGIVGTLSFHFLTPHDAIIPWKPFSAAEATRLADEGNTVLVDFTANWCLTCKANLKFAIETEAVMRAIEDNKVVPMLADWTDGSAEIKDALAKLNSNSIPVLAIYPAGKSGSPMVLRDVITQGQVLEAIEKAGPSKPAENLTASKVQ